MNTNPDSGRHGIALTMEQLRVVLALPADVATVSLSDAPYGVKVVWEGPPLPDGWTLPNGAADHEPWRPDQPIIKSVGAIHPGGRPYLAPRSQWREQQ